MTDGSMDLAGGPAARTMILVDSHPMSRNAEALFFRGLGFDVRSFSCVRKVKEAGPGAARIIVLDFCLHCGTGSASCIVELRAMYPDAAILMLSADTTTVTDEGLLRLVDRMLCKPAAAATVRDTVEALLAATDATIDEDHRKIMGAVHDAQRAVRNGAGFASTMGMLAETIDLLAGHFAREEQALRVLHSSEQEEHRQEHSRILSAFGDVIADAEAAGNRVNAAALDVLTDTVDGHLTSFDRRLAELSAARGPA